jgi:hypothetical protein
MDNLHSNVRTIGFDDADALLISTAVAVTRNFAFPARIHLVGETSRLESRKQLIDALGVTFMFNIVNRVANFYSLQPEWTELRRSNAVRSLTRPLMSFGLTTQMPLANDPKETDEDVFPNVEPLLHHFGVKEVSLLWQGLDTLPSVRMAIYQLLWTAVNCSETDSEYTDAVTQECLGTAKGPHHEMANSEMSAWAELYATPHRFSISAWPMLEISDGTTVDILFRVSLLAAIHKFNCEALQDFSAELLDRTG